MTTSLLNILVLGMLFAPGFFLAASTEGLNGRTVARVLLWNVGIFLCLGLLIQAFPTLIDPR